MRVLIILPILALLICNTAFAAVSNHGAYGQPRFQESSAGAGGTFQVTRNTGEYAVSFHVLPVVDGLRQGNTHSVMVKVERAGQVITDAKINSRVLFPDKTEQQQLLMRSGDWYAANYDMQGQARHQIMVLFQTADGKMHRTGTYFPK